MTPREQAHLVHAIPKEAWHQVRVKRGQTNGRLTVHVIDLDERTSTTIYTVGEWMAHPLNRSNRPSKRRQEPDVGLVANFIHDMAEEMRKLSPAARKASLSLHLLAEAHRTEEVPAS